MLKALKKLKKQGRLKSKLMHERRQATADRRQLPTYLANERRSGIADRRKRQKN